MQDLNLSHTRRFIFHEILPEEHHVQIERLILLQDRHDSIRDNIGQLICHCLVQFGPQRRSCHTGQRLFIFLLERNLEFLQKRQNSLLRSIVPLHRTSNRQSEPKA